LGIMDDIPSTVVPHGCVRSGWKEILILSQGWLGGMREDVLD